MITSALRVLRGSLAATALLSVASAQNNPRPDPPARPNPINPGGGGIIGGGGIGGGGIIGGGGGGIIGGGGGIGFPFNPLNPGFGAVVNPGPRIVTAAGMIAGQTLQASVVVPDQPATAAAGASGASGTTSTPTYQWAISGGRITTDPSQPSVNFTADAAGSVTLNVVVIGGGPIQSGSTEVVVLSPAMAGNITSPATARPNTAALSATVPAAQSGDRTFRWSLGGSGGTITGGQGTNRVTFRAGAPGVLEVKCDVTLQRVATVPVRSFVVVTGDGPPTALTINQGSGGGTHLAGSRVDIFADPPDPGHVFDRWIGDTGILGDDPLAAVSAHAIATMPATPVTLTATYRSVAEWSPTSIARFNPVAPMIPNGTLLAYHIPDDAKGLVLLLHEASGTAINWFARPEKLALARDLVAAGYGVAALNSIDRTLGNWSTRPTVATNPDLTALVAALEHFAREGRITTATPLFLLGTGNGGEAAARFAQQLTGSAAAPRIKGAIVYCSSGDALSAATSRVPQLFALAANDDAAEGNPAETARENAQLFAGRGVASTVLFNRASPLPAGRFRALGMASNGFSAADAQAVWTALKTGGLLDANNYPKAVPTVEAVRAALPADFKSRAADIATQLAIGFGASEFFSDVNSRVLAFLEEQIADTVAPAPGRLVNLSTRTSIAYLGDTFTLGFILTGPERATLLVRGVGPALSRFGVVDPLPAPRLQVHRGSTLLASNEAWDINGSAAEIMAATASSGAFTLARGSRDAAVLLTLEPGAYTVTLTSVNGAVGGVLAEIFDVSKNSTRLTNLSTFARIGVEGEGVSTGIAIAGSAPRTLIARAIGPGLVDLGIPGNTVLADPRMVIANRAGQTIANNNNWTQRGTSNDPTLLGAVFASAGAFPLKTSNADAALVHAFAPGNYLLQTTPAPTIGELVVGAPPPVMTGMVLVEIYEVP